MRTPRPDRFRGAIFSLLVTCLLLAGTLPAVFARAGGGEGFPGSPGPGSGGGGSGSDSEAFFYLLWHLLDLAYHYPLIGIPLIILLIIAAAYGAFEGRERYVDYTIRRGTQAQPQVEQARAVARLRQRDPAWNQTAFLGRVRQAFLAIQHGWAKADLGTAQAFLSDGVYDRFQILLRELAEAGLRNRVTDVRVVDTAIRQVDSDDHYDTIHVAIRATAIDCLVSATTGQWVEGPTTPEMFEEVWTFLRRPSARTLARPGLIEGFCPNCSAPVEMARVAICAACQSYLRSGEHDWVLAVITQASEWAPRPATAVPGLTAYRQLDPGFHLQHLEDRASVVFWRHALAERLGDVGPLRKYALDPFLAGFALRLQPGEDGTRHFFTRCAVGGVRAKAILPGEPFDRVFVEIAWSGRPTERRRDGRTVAAGPGTRRLRNVFVLVRRHGVTTPTRTSLDSAHCPNCGAPEQTGQEFACPYCDTVLNDGSQDWVLERLLGVNDTEVLNAIRQAGQPNRPASRPAPRSGPDTAAPTAQPGLSPEPTPAPPAAMPPDATRPSPTGPSETTTGSDSSLDSSDRPPTPLPSLDILEWLVATMLADGVIDEKEMALLHDMGRRLGVSEARVLETVAAHQAEPHGFDRLPVPATPFEAREMLRSMAAMALADGRLTDKEMALLISFGRKVALSPLDVNLLVKMERQRLFQEARRILQEQKKLLDTPDHRPPA
ncbi:MAG: putative membrane protein [Candidatus Ozemobacter sibiricus]|uniref:Putative membrane protein n=1 Tax=Candidatus Ozemobacter sibiricus TaxID=2268124 RepID=A0A367ZS81_9BACT|nr:MAG: putative membrane protein [Candidatus Ozemobacter sibiricus]